MLRASPAQAQAHPIFTSLPYVEVGTPRAIRGGGSVFTEESTGSPTTDKVVPGRQID